MGKKSEARREARGTQKEKIDRLEDADLIEYETKLEPIPGGIRDEYMEITIQFGYVSMFASVAPWLIVFATVINVIDMHADSWKLLYRSRRMPDEAAKGIGIWYYIFEFVVYGSILTN